MAELRGWEHDCGFHCDTETLFLDHLEKCRYYPLTNVPIYKSVIDEFGNMSEVIDD